jgi:hypothetical protein
MKTLKQRRLLRVLPVALLPTLMPPTFAHASTTEAYVKIAAPADGARVQRTKPITLVYEANPGPRGEHVHVYVDGKEVGILRQLEGNYALKRLTPGQRTVCVKVVNRAHVPIGVEQCIKLEVE